jgi:hypothetical protein
MDDMVIAGHHDERCSGDVRRDRLPMVTTYVGGHRRGG